MSIGEILQFGSVRFQIVQFQGAVRAIANQFPAVLSYRPVAFVLPENGLLSLDRAAVNLLPFRQWVERDFASARSDLAGPTPPVSRSS